MKALEQGSYIPSLDGLRCVAIVPVFFSHALTAANLPSFIPGNFGVTVFFFLSGYLITTLLRMEMERTGTVSFKGFYLRRILRIFPTCYLVLGIAAGYGLYSGAMNPLWLMGQVFQLTNYQIIFGGWSAPIAPYTFVYWSLAVEEHFYLAFPFVFIMLARLDSRRHQAMILLSFCGLIFLWRCWLIFGLQTSYDRTYLATDTRIDSILFGCALAIWGNPALDPTMVSESTWKRTFLPLAIIVIVLSLVVGGRAFRETFSYSIQGICLYVIFITAVRYPEWGPMRMLNYPLVRWIGTLSYAIYLLHLLILAFCKSLLGNSPVLLLPLAVVLTVASAAAIYYGIERPMGRLRRRFHSA